MCFSFLILPSLDTAAAKSVSPERRSNMPPGLGPVLFMNLKKCDIRKVLKNFFD